MIAEITDPSPFGPGRHAVSVGSMLFDANFFQIAAASFPEITFHVIGSGAKQGALPASVHVYGEMPFRETLKYLKYADFGIAPYKVANLPYYLCDTSMKLMQYEFLGLPAVCPHFVVGEHISRFGYQPDDAESIGSAIRAAMNTSKRNDGTFLDWEQVTARI